MIFSRTDCVPSNLTSFISCGISLTANICLKEVNNKCNVIGTNVIKIKEITHE